MSNKKLKIYDSGIILSYLNTLNDNDLFELLKKIGISFLNSKKTREKNIIRIYNQYYQYDFVKKIINEILKKVDLKKLKIGINDFDFLDAEKLFDNKNLFLTQEEFGEFYTEFSHEKNPKFHTPAFQKKLRSTDNIVMLICNLIERDANNIYENLLLDEFINQHTLNQKRQTILDLFYNSPYKGSIVDYVLLNTRVDNYKALSLTFEDILELTVIDVEILNKNEVILYTFQNGLLKCFWEHNNINVHRSFEMGKYVNSIHYEHKIKLDDIKKVSIKVYNELVELIKEEKQKGQPVPVTRIYAPSPFSN